MAAWPHATSEMAGCRSKASKGRNTKFNKDILEATDPNGDVISVWCRQMSADSGFCTMCNQTIACKQHGVSAIMRHATNKRHIEATRQHRDASGLLKRQSTIQSCLDFTPKMVISPSGPSNTSRDHFCCRNDTQRGAILMGGHCHNALP
ncbi:hypothetical protein MRX96_027288 [Rhipicephalus microplus]